MRISSKRFQHTIKRVTLNSNCDAIRPIFTFQINGKEECMELAILRFNSVGNKCFLEVHESGIHEFVVKFKDVADVHICKICSESLKMNESMSACKPKMSQTIPTKKVMSRCPVGSVH